MRELPVPCSRRLRALLLLSALALPLLAPGASSAFLQFRPARLLETGGEHAAVVKNFEPKVAGDGQGRWMTVWLAEVAEDVIDVRLVKSQDNGRSWSSASTLWSNVGDDAWYQSPVIGSDSAGRWIVAWQHGSQIVVAHSDDFGANWSTPQQVFLTGFQGYTWNPDLDLRTDRAGNWILLMGAQSGVASVSSSDNGDTWSAVQRIAEPSPIVTGIYLYMEDVALTASGGRWIATWTEREYPTSGRVFAASSTDLGATWSVATLLSESSGIYWPTVAAEEDGHVYVFWHSSDNYASLEMRQSHDGGASWAPQEELGFPLYNATVRNDGPGVWYVVGTDFPRILQSRSIDDGASWSPVYAASRESFEQASSVRRFGIESDGAGTWQLVWLDSKLFGADSDHSGHIYPSLVSASSTTLCPPLPANDCQQPATAGASRLSMRNDAGSLRGDSITWTWRGFTAGGPAALGDPSADEQYALCLYDSSVGSYRRVFELALTLQDDCTVSPCWKAGRNLWSFHDGFGLHGELHSAKLKISPLPDAKTKFVLAASGPALTPPPLPPRREPDLVAQLHSLVAGSCWTASYSSPSSDTAERFTSKSD